MFKPRVKSGTENPYVFCVYSLLHCNMTDSVFSLGVTNPSGDQFANQANWQEAKSEVAQKTSSSKKSVCFNEYVKNHIFLCPRDRAFWQCWVGIHFNRSWKKKTDLNPCLATIHSPLQPTEIIFSLWRDIWGSTQSIPHNHIKNTIHHVGMGVVDWLCCGASLPSSGFVQ